jgi:16S rRNA C967 or C1407 C5-methylase (RsmB/RsmF family)/NOL1/NOP2/fmu family ribosome biogenesis protein
VASFLPKELLDSLEGLPGYDAAAFNAVHASGEQVTSIRVNPGKAGTRLQRGAVRVPWSSWGYYVAERPSFTLDPLFHAGTYYVQEASSMFLEQAVRQHADVGRPLRVLDCCAAPGGKSTLLQSVITADSLLVSNEVIRSRVGVLSENLTKWGACNVIVTNNDPRDFAALENYFDVIVVDAPCSGSGLFRREPEAVAEWSPANVQLCSQRQQRILADCWPALRQDGLLIYSTCSYSREEGEAILDWLVADLDAASCPLAVPPEWNIVETIAPSGARGYRFYPDRLKGEGFFLACVRKQDGGTFAAPRRLAAPERPSKQERERMGEWVREGEHFYFRHKEEVHALPGSLGSELSVLQSKLYLRKAGVKLGMLTPKEFIPDHELAVSTVLSPQVPGIAVPLEEALRYLRKDEMRVESGSRGWAVIRYEGSGLGWVKVLPNRINNYYPKEWRILKRD